MKGEASAFVIEKSWLNLGNVYHDLKRNQDAINAYQRAIELDPTSAEAYSRLGIAWYDFGEYGKAIAVIQTTCTERANKK